MFNRKKRQPIIKDFEEFLKAYNCTYSINRQNQIQRIQFKYQGGEFMATFQDGKDFAEIQFPCITTVPIDKLPIVRLKCNELSYNNMLFKFCYTINHEENNIDIHISFFNNRIDKEEFANELSAAFQGQRQWRESFDEAVKLTEQNDSSDIESDLYQHHREMYLLRQMELRHQLNGDTVMTTGTHALTLWQMLETVSPIPCATLLFMTVNTVDGQRRINDTTEIRSFDLRRALVEGEGKEARPVRDYALLDLHYTQGMDKKPRVLTIVITAEGADEHRIYSRVTITQVPRNVARNNSLSNEGRQNPLSVSLLIALDRSNDKQREQEFHYMWTEAQHKLRDGDFSSMTEDQKMLGQVANADVAYNLYWGQQMFYSERYYEAMLYFENVVNSYRSDFFELKSEHRNAFLETVYMLGFCYNELGMPKQAFYYLDLVASDGNIRHTMELINSMANSKDLRLFSYTEGVMDEVKRNFSDVDELPENIKDFINFMRRRRGYAFIDFNQLDKAEKIFTQMLDEEENADYAINELAYIKKLRKERGEDDATEKTQSQGNPNDTYGSKGQDDQPPL